MTRRTCIMSCRTRLFWRRPSFWKFLREKSNSYGWTILGGSDLLDGREHECLEKVGTKDCSEGISSP